MERKTIKFENLIEAMQDAKVEHYIIDVEYHCDEKARYEGEEDLESEVFFKFENEIDAMDWDFIDAFGYIMTRYYSENFILSLCQAFTKDITDNTFKVYLEKPERYKDYFLYLEDPKSKNAMSTDASSEDVLRNTMQKELSKFNYNEILKEIGADIQNVEKARLSHWS